MQFEQQRFERSVLFIELVILENVLIKDLILISKPLLLSASACVQLLSLVLVESRLILLIIVKADSSPFSFLLSYIH